MFLAQDADILEIIQNPYFVHWLDKWFPKKAWDASVYSYMFKSFDKVPTNQDDYIWFAKAWYYEYSKNEWFADWIWTTLPTIQNMFKENDLLKRWKLRLIK